MKHLPALFAGLATFVALLLCVFLGHASQMSAFGQTERSHVTDRLAKVRVLLESELNSRLSLVRGLAAYAETNPTFSDEEFQHFAAHLSEDHKGIRSLQLAPKAVVRHIYPLKGNEAAMGHDLMADPARREAAERAIEGKKFIVAGPIELRQGGVALIGRLPIFHTPPSPSDTPEEFWGFSIILIDLDPLLGESGFFKEDTRLHLALRGKDGRGAQGEVFFGDPAIFNDAPVTQEISLPNGTWIIAGTPHDGWAKTWPGQIWFLGLGVGLALMAGGLVYFLLRRNAEIREESIQRSLSAELLEKKSQDLERSNAAFQQFAYVASHDLREPLRTVVSYLQLLEKKYRNTLGDEAREFIDFAVNGAKRMDSLIKDLLIFSRVETSPATLSPVDSGIALQEALGNLAATLEETSGEVTLGSLPRVQADHTQLVQLFQNLVGNALKYRRAEVAPEITISAIIENGWATFAVQDNGIGIDAEHFERIFLVFQRLHHRDEFEGTGIGLAVCRKIVERHGGQIWIDSTPGQGSTFFFTLKAAA